MGVVASLLILVLWLFVIVILVRVVFSWVGPFGYGGRNYGRRSSGFLSSVSDLAFRITEPVLAPVRHRLPPMSGMDLSPLVVTVACYFLIHALGFVGN